LGAATQEKCAATALYMVDNRLLHCKSAFVVPLFDVAVSPICYLIMQYIVYNIFKMRNGIFARLMEIIVGG